MRMLLMENYYEGTYNLVMHIVCQFEMYSSTANGLVLIKCHPSGAQLWLVDISIDISPLRGFTIQDSTLKNNFPEFY